MIIYRIENEKGQGPYTSMSFFTWTNCDHNDKKHPSLAEDNFHIYYHDNKYDFLDNFHIYYHDNKYDFLDNFNVSPLNDYYFGFDSLEKLNNWFSLEELKNLKELNYKVVKYQVGSEFILDGESRLQVMFKKSEAKKID